MTAQAHIEALHRATHNQSPTNETRVIEEFTNRGYEDVRPRENVFTFAAWKAKGRIVKKGEHGVRLEIFVKVKDQDWVNEDGSPIYNTIRKFTTVFHIDQTKEL